tara:strand:- start:60 stop:884 length:825 start_codon:yes stop_codon:yes gene_type:complete
MSDLRVLSLGAGVQSTTLALMIEHGEIPMVDCGIFADTKGEPQNVYKHLDWLEKQLSYPIYRVTWRDLKQDIFDASRGMYKGFTAPFYTLSDQGKKGILRRQCTADYKIKPVTKKIRELLGYKKGERVKKGTKVELIMGISYDELFRMRENRLKYVQNIYPLVDKGIRRHNCLDWIKQKNYPQPPRSACTFCPFHSNLEWRKIKENKEEWQEVVKMDKAIRDQEEFKKSKYAETIKDKLFLHNQRVPLDEVDLRTDEEKGQYSLLDECEGMCGV